MSKSYLTPHREGINSIRDFIHFKCKTYQDRVFSRVYRDGKVISKMYPEFEQEVLCLAAALLRRGITGKHIALFSENSHEYYVIYFATILAGNVFIPMNIDLPDEKAILLTNFSDAEIVLVSKQQEKFIALLREHCPAVQQFIGVGEDVDADLQYQTLLSEVPFEEAEQMAFYGDIFDDRTASICFTSGTSGGLPKGVMLTARNIMSPVTFGVVDAYMGMEPFFEYEINERMLPLPMYHMAALNTFFILVTFGLGFTLDICEATKYIFRDANIFHPQYIMMVPALGDTVAKMLEAEVDRMGEREKFERFSHLCDYFHVPTIRRHKFTARYKGPVGGRLSLASLLGAKHMDQTAKTLQKFGIYVFGEYGMTECSPMVTVVADLGIDLPEGSCGKLGAFNLGKIVDGILYLKGDNIMKGYYKNPEGTAEVLSEDGWLDTGDVARFDENGYLYIQGRRNNIVVLANGDNIDVEELEPKFAASPLIREIVIIGDKKNDNNTLGALIYPDEEEVQKVGGDAEKAIAEVVAKVNRELPLQQRIARYRLVNQPFQRNAMMKLQRYLYVNEEI